MAKLYFRYGAMGAGKTMDILKVAYNYEERGQKVIILKPKQDTRDGKMTIKSRVDGLQREGGILEDFMEKSEEEIKTYDCVLIDDCFYFVCKYTHYFYIWQKNQFFCSRNVWVSPLFSLPLHTERGLFLCFRCLDSPFFVKS